jgi:hypothetical protein
MNTDALLDKLTKAVTHQYNSDPSCPSVILSYIKGKYYTSIVRYTRNYGEGKQIVCHLTADTINDALKGISCIWLEQTGVNINPVEDLKLSLQAALK